MIPVPPPVMNDYVALLMSRDIVPPHVEYYKKWLRYFYDFSAKYLDADDKHEKVRLFLDKLRSKQQSPTQCQQAAHAITLYFELQDNASPGNTVSEEPSHQPSSREPLMLPSPSQQPVTKTPSVPYVKRLRSQYSVAGYEEKSDSPEWDELLVKLADEIKVRHYSRKTLQTYALWSRQFQRFLKNKPPQELTTDDVKAYLTFLAVKCNVAASTQDQAFNSLLFLFRHALKRDFGILRDVPRAKKSLYIPVVLSRAEIDAILAHLHPDQAGTRQPEDHHDLHPLHAGAHHQGGTEPAGFLRCRCTMPATKKGGAISGAPFSFGPR